jgi:hypothetical protein
MTTDIEGYPEGKMMPLPGICKKKFQKRGINTTVMSAETLSMSNVESLVYGEISEEIVKEMILHVQREKPTLWGASKPRTFISRQVLLTLYKDLTGIGFDKLSTLTHDMNQVNKDSLRENIKRVREVLCSWADKQINLGDQSTWRYAARNTNFPKPHEEVSLWFDSADFRLSGKRSTSKKDDWWSFKLNSPGVRYMVILDAKTNCRGIYGPYSPKVFDGHWLSCHSDWLEQHLSGAHVAADQHFEWGRDNLRGVKFHTPFKKKAKKRKPGHERPLSTLTQEQKQYNTSLYEVRARVESIFGVIKTKWKALQNPFFESHLQHKFITRTAVAIYNRENQ